MSNIFEIIKKALKNKVLYYIFSRYATFFIQFINSLFIAVFLGPYYLGIWGFIRLVIEYLNQINLGISHSVNAIISIHNNKEWYIKKIIGTSITMLISLSLFIILFFIANKLLNLNIGSKYNFSTYAPAVAAIGILAYFNSLFSNIFRVYGKVTEIAINQSAFPVLMLITILIFRGENLLWALVGANFIAFLLSFILYLYKTPVNLRPQFICRLAKTIQTKGWHLFVYNTSFYLIIISTKSFISGYYSVEEFGYFTFAYSLANVVLLLLQSFSFLIFPKLINRMANAANEKVLELLVIVRDLYVTSSHLLAHVAILLIPVFILYFPQYQKAENVFKLTALTVVLYSNAFGYSSLLIAKRNEKKLGYFALMALAFNIISIWVLAELFNVNFEFVILGTMLANFIYIFLLTYTGRKKMDLKTDTFIILKDTYPIRLFIPFFLSLFLIILTTNGFFFLIPIVLFIILNNKELVKIGQVLKRIISNPLIINI
ncbi:oligosaccharide flippase family protein [Draconibacterium orientale]|uniref:lipopolysaccharide biosynthesis protein n=1 Tax=Draconibacterium orientale TaxID=1168034 RepID=UPI002A0A3C12|nr:oligosaccharide flippase family protein [Draconibacterium orientale]